MTIIDTTTYCNGELRLARHGAGKGGTVLVHVPTGEQANINPEFDQQVETDLNNLQHGVHSSRQIFDDLKVLDDRFAD